MCCCNMGTNVEIGSGDELIKLSDEPHPWLNMLVFLPLITFFFLLCHHQQCFLFTQGCSSKMLSSAYSSNTMGDGPRSEAAIARRSKSRRAKFIAKTEVKRQLQVNNRTDPEATINPILQFALPTLQGSRSRPKKTTVKLPSLPSSRKFYEVYKGGNKWLELRTGGTIAGTQDDKGIFALCMIPPRTRLAPYLGKVLPNDSSGPYCLLVKDCNNMVICLDSQHELYDVGYTMGMSTYHKERTPTQPNYGRYVNSLTPEQQATGLTFNAQIVADLLEGFSWIQSGKNPIPEGQEILVDYGNSYWVQ